jgi:hypothetical protein
MGYEKFLSAAHPVYGFLKVHIAKFSRFNNPSDFDLCAGCSCMLPCEVDAQRRT